MLALGCGWAGWSPAGLEWAAWAFLGPVAPCSWVWPPSLRGCGGSWPWLLWLRGCLWSGGWLWAIPRLLSPWSGKVWSLALLWYSQARLAPLHSRALEATAFWSLPGGWSVVQAPQLGVGGPVWLSHKVGPCSWNFSEILDAEVPVFLSFLGMATGRSGLYSLGT